MKIVLTCNIRPPSHSEEFAEWDEPATIQAIEQGLSSLGHEVSVLDCHNIDIKNELENLKPEFVFNVAEGLEGYDRESIVPLILEELKIPYTGSCPLVLENGLHKAKTKEILKEHNIPTPLWAVIDNKCSQLLSPLSYPVILKPLGEGSSKGIKNSSLVYNERDFLSALKDISGDIIVEDFLVGREFTVGLIGNNDDLEIFPPVEINFDSLPFQANPIYSYEAKWVWDTVANPLQIFTCPAEIDETLEKSINEIVRKSFNALGCYDWARIDLRADKNGKINVIEINPLPGIIPDPDANSCFPKACRAKGLSYVDILEKVLRASVLRCKKNN